MSGSVQRIGVVVNRVPGVARAIDEARRAESLGFGAAWLTNGGPEDCMPLLAAITQTTTRVRLGTSVLQTYPRHPVVVAAEANVIDQLAPGRLRLGVGPSHDAVMAGLGLSRHRPLTHLREYVTVFRGLVTTGAVDFAGTEYQVHASLGRVVDVPIMVGALQPATFELAGAISDGAITWLCPARYLREVALPRMTAAADAHDRARPPLVARVAVCVHERGEEVRAAIRATVPNIGFPSYQRMLQRAGFDEAARGVWTDQLVDEVIAWGAPEHVVQRIEECFDAGADEVLIRPVAPGGAPDGVIDRTLVAIADAFRG